MFNRQCDFDSVKKRIRYDSQRNYNGYVSCVDNNYRNKSKTVVVTKKDV